MTYAGFWRRLVAQFVDILILLPLALVHIWANHTSRNVSLSVVVPLDVLSNGYEVYLLGRYGQTIGKRVVRVRVVRTDGTAISWREAWLRSSVNIVLGAISCVGAIVVLKSIPETYFSLNWVQRSALYTASRPPWLRWVMWAQQCWVWGELVVLLSNRRRRALHDFMAGTVVVVDPP